MKDIVFDTGVVAFTINGACEISFNPTDSNFVKRLFDAFDYLDGKQDAYRAEVEKLADKKQIFEVAKARDKEMREVIDGVFGISVCDALFGAMNVYALADGLPVWANLILAVMDEIDTSFARESKATNPRIQKYTAKYHK